MRIAQLCSVSHKIGPNSPYGIYNLVGNLCDSLVSHANQVTLFSAGDAETKAKKMSILPINSSEQHLSEKVTIVNNLETASLCFRNRENFDIIHTHFTLLGCHFSATVDTPTLHSVHSPITDEMHQHLTNYKKEKFISFSLAQREQMPELNWVANIYHGIDTSVYAFNETPGDYVLYLGRITEDKGVHHAIAAAKVAKVKLIIAGVSHHTESYWSKEIEPQIDGVQVQFFGHANMEQKIKLMQNARALLFPTLAKETFGLVMIESMSCGTPVIGFDEGAVKEVVQDKETGFVVKNEKQMVSAIKKIKTIDRRATRARVEKFFSLERMTRGYEKVYQRYIK